MKILNHKKHFLLTRISIQVIVFCYLFLVLGVNAAANTLAGEIVYTKGIVSLARADTAIKILGQGSQLHVGDRIVTGKNSQALFTLLDGSKLSLPENSDFKITKLLFTQSQQLADLHLLNGGVRIVTGAINKQNNGNYRLTTPLADLDVRGTDFTARLCEKDCNQDNIRAAGKRKIVKDDASVQARLIIKRGDVKAKDNNGQLRNLHKESPVYSGDTIITADKALAVIVFKDDTRTTVQQNTEFSINEFIYKENNSDDNKADFELIKGSLRFLTGKIGKKNRDKYKISTRNSTIGIRGTGFDLAFYNETYLALWEGAVDLISPVCEIRVENGDIYFSADKDACPEKIQKMPEIFTLGPRPDANEIKEKANLPYLFGSRYMTGEAGLYFYVKNGEVEARNSKVRINLGEKEAAYVSKNTAYRIADEPAFVTDGIVTPVTTRQAVDKPRSAADKGKPDTDENDGVICEI